jgi:hypothetical protein
MKTTRYLIELNHSHEWYFNENEKELAIQTALKVHKEDSRLDIKLFEFDEFTADGIHYTKQNYKLLDYTKAP